MLKYNWININNEIKNIELLPDDVEKTIRLQLLDSITDKVNEYNSHVSDYEYSRKWKEIGDRGVVLVSQSNLSAIKANWSKLFAVNVSSEEKKDISYKDYKWHIFSYEKVNAHLKSKAKKAFNRCKKENVYAFYQHKDKAYYVENPQLLKASDFDLDFDIYIFDTKQKWTYVHTHESQCGPYFCQL